MFVTSPRRRSDDRESSTALPPSSSSRRLRVKETTGSGIDVVNVKVDDVIVDVVNVKVDDVIVIVCSCQVWYKCIYKLIERGKKKRGKDDEISL